jgi:hypothetical protein
LRRFVEPGRTAAKSEQPGRNQDPLGNAPFIEVFGDRLVPIEHDRDRERRTGDPANPLVDLADLSELGLVLDHHEMPWLEVAGASRPSGNLEDLVQDVIGNITVQELTHLAHLPDCAKRIEMCRGN